MADDVTLENKPARESVGGELIMLLISNLVQVRKSCYSCQCYIVDAGTDVKGVSIVSHGW